MKREKLQRRFVTKDNWKTRMLRAWRWSLFWPTFLIWGVFALLTYVDKQHKKKWFWYVLYPVGVVFLLLDCIYNYTVGWLMWWRKPKWPLYTDTLQAAYDDGLVHARHQADILNLLDPGHIKL